MVKNYPTLKNLASLFFLLFSIAAFSQTSQTFITSGTFTAPAGVTQVTVEAWGGGGKGASGTPSRGTAGGSGAGGGAYAKKNIVTVDPIISNTVTVGTGSTNNTLPGGDSYFINITTILAKGGNSVPTNIAPGGLGGSAASSIGDVGSVFSGGNGARGIAGPGASGKDYGGGGGSSAGTGVFGNYTGNISNNLGATAPTGGGNGGNGGDYESTAGNVGNGVAPGGGGGGALWVGYTGGGNGANGQVRITWTCPTYSLSSTNVTTPICINNGAVVTLNGPATSLPRGTYTVTYNQSAPNLVTGATKTMTVTTPGTGSFTTNNLANIGATTITITNLSSGSGTPNCSSTISVNNSATVIVSSVIPATPGTITQPTNKCSGSTGNTFSIAAVGGATSYTWSVTGTGWAVTAGGTTTSATITIGTGIGTVSVTATNGCGTSAASTTGNITPTTLAAPTTTNAFICTGSSASLAASGAIATQFYKWYSLETGGLLLKTGTNNTDNTYATPAITLTTDYWVAIVNSNGCESIRTKATAFVNVKNIWTGNAYDENWNTAGNWCLGVVPIESNAASLEVIIPKDVVMPMPDGTPNYPIIAATGLSGVVNNIEIQQGASVTIEGVTNILTGTGTGKALTIAGILTLNGIIDLNGESQLIQSTGSTLDVASTGTIEIDQQGTGDSFNYNYWSSPVNSNLATKTYSIGEVLRDGTDPNAIIKPEITFGPGHTWAELVIGTSPIRLSTYWMYKLENSKGYAAWTRIGKDISIKVGEGYTMKGSNTTAPMQNYTFVGKPNNGDISLPIAVNNDYLVGNPYPSAIDAYQFIDDNLAHTGPLYFWEHSGGGTHNLAGYQGGYATLTKSGGVPGSSPGGQVAGVGTNAFANKVPVQYIPVGQAFFVVGEIVGQIQFKNSQRDFVKESLGISLFMKSGNTKSKSENIRGADLRPKFRIGFDAPKISHRQVLLTIDERATPAFDRGYEAEIYEVFEDDFYWMLDGKKYVIQATNNVGLNSEVPIGIQLSKTGLVTVKIDALENVDDDTTIYLKDKVTGESFNMREKPIQLNLTAGKYADRFMLVFKTQKLVAEDVNAEILIPATSQPIIEGIHVFMNNTISELQIKNNSTEEIVSVALINSLGQTVKTWNSNFNIRTISLPLSTATGVYVVQINTKTGKTVKKISLE